MRHDPSFARHQLAALALATVLTVPLSCGREGQEGEVTDAQGCRTIVLPEPGEAETSSSTTGDGTTTTTGAAPYCGDGVVDLGEQCDHGVNNGPGDGCNVKCTINACGDGELGAPENEDCDDGNLDSTDECTAGCRLARCGDGDVHAGVEACDDGNDDASDACTTECKDAVCGDGFKQEGVEECDDGNDVDGDGCTVDCYLERIVFVSSVPYKGNADGLNGLGGADSKCQGLATEAKLPGEYMAWLSTADDSPATRFGIDPDSLGPYKLVDGTLVATSWGDLVDGLLLSGISLNESSNPVTASAWTNTAIDGISAGAKDCGGWLRPLPGETAIIGASTNAGAGWTNGGTANCANSYRIYCVQVR